MRKITAIFIILALIMAVAVACGKKEEELTTQPIDTQYSPYTEPTAPVAELPSESGAVTYVLTTRADKTVPWVSTTRFEITEATTTTSAPKTEATDYNINFDVSAIDRPNVNVSQMSTTKKKKPKTTADSDNKDNKTTTKKKAAKATSLIVNSYAYGDGVIYVEVDSSNWNGKFTANTQNINVTVDGVKMETSVPCKISSSSYEIKIDVSALEVESGSVIDFTIPSGAVKNQSGSQTNTSYSASVTV